MNPCPSDTGEPMKMMMQDQRLLQKRPDVLVYTTPAFTEETEITGPIYVELYASTDARDTDFCARCHSPGWLGIPSGCEAGARTLPQR